MNLIKKNPTQDVVSEISELTEKMIDRACDPDFDVQKLKEILNIKISLLDRQAEADFNADFFALKRELRPILQKGAIQSNSGNKVSSYARYEDIQNEINPLMEKFNFRIRHTSENQNPEIRVITIITHISGHSEKTEMTLRRDRTNQLKGEVQADVATISYGKRRNLINLFDITQITEESEIYQNMNISAEQADRIEKIMICSGTDLHALLQWCGCESIQEIPLKKYDQAINLLKSKIERNKKG